MDLEVARDNDECVECMEEGDFLLVAEGKSEGTFCIGCLSDWLADNVEDTI